MANDRMTRQQWVALFEATGLDEQAMDRWHRLFEDRHPDAHEGFLDWLGVAPDEIRSIREQSRGRAS